MIPFKNLFVNTIIRSIDYDDGKGSLYKPDLKMRIASVIIGIAFVGVAVFMGVAMVRESRPQDNPAARWPVVTGTMMRCIAQRPPNEPDRGRLDVLYRFEVNHRRYQGTKYAWIPQKLTFEEAQAIATRLLPQKPCTVHYDPAGPWSCYLAPLDSTFTPEPPPLAVPCMFVIFLVAGIWVPWRILRS